MFVYLISNQNHAQMKLKEFKQLEKTLGHPPTQEEVRTHKAIIEWLLKTCLN